MHAPCRCGTKQDGREEVLTGPQGDASDEGQYPASFEPEDSRCDLSVLLASAAGLRSHREEQQQRRQQQGGQPQSPSAASAASAQTRSNSPFAAVSGSGFSFDRAGSVPSSLQPRARWSSCACIDALESAFLYGSLRDKESSPCQGATPSFYPLVIGHGCSPWPILACGSFRAVHDGPALSDKPVTEHACSRRPTSLVTWREANTAQRNSLSSDDCSSEMNADCCGDSGARAGHTWY